MYQSRFQNQFRKATTKKSGDLLPQSTSMPPKASNDQKLFEYRNTSSPGQCNASPAYQNSVDQHLEFGLVITVSEAKKMPNAAKAVQNKTLQIPSRRQTTWCPPKEPQGCSPQLQWGKLLQHCLTRLNQQIRRNKSVPFKLVLTGNPCLRKLWAFLSSLGCLSLQTMKTNESMKK